jgi:hypothetical protein
MAAIILGVADKVKGVGCRYQLPWAPHTAVMKTCRLGMFLLVQMLLTYVLSGTSGFGILQVMFGHRSGLH